jgi:hypothetical protein
MDHVHSFPAARLVLAYVALIMLLIVWETMSFAMAVKPVKLKKRKPIIAKTVPNVRLQERLEVV